MDASQYAAGGILYQVDKKGRLEPVAYFLKAFTEAERNYPVYDQEFLAILLSLEHNRPILLSFKEKVFNLLKNNFGQAGAP